MSKTKYLELLPDSYTSLSGFLGTMNKTIQHNNIERCKHNPYYACALETNEYIKLYVELSSPNLQTAIRKAKNAEPDTMHVNVGDAIETAGFIFEKDVEGDGLWSWTVFETDYGTYQNQDYSGESDDEIHSFEEAIASLEDYLYTMAWLIVDFEKSEKLYTIGEMIKDEYADIDWAWGGIGLEYGSHNEIWEQIKDTWSPYYLEHSDWISKELSELSEDDFYDLQNELQNEIALNQGWTPQEMENHLYQLECQEDSGEFVGKLEVAGGYISSNL